MDLAFEHELHKEVANYPHQFNQAYVNREINLAKHAMQFCFANIRLSEQYFPAMAHLEVLPSHSNHQKLVLYVLDASQFNKSADELAQELFKNAYIKAGLALQKPETSKGHYLNSGGFLYYYSEKMQFGFWIVDNITALSNWHFANPFRFFLYDFLARKSIQTSHVAAVSNDHSAVLLAGPSGAGKSTTALACFERNLNLLGDDHCLFSIADKPLVFSLYNSVKIDEKKLDQFPHFRLKARHDIHNLEVKKAIFYVNTPKNDHGAKPIKAILKLDRSAPENRPTLHKISPRETLQVMLLSTLAQCPWVKSNLVMEHHQHLTQKVRGFCLKLSQDFEENTALIKRILDE